MTLTRIVPSVRVKPNVVGINRVICCQASLGGQHHG